MTLEILFPSVLFLIVYFVILAVVMRTTVYAVIWTDPLGVTCNKIYLSLALAQQCAKEYPRACIVSQTFYGTTWLKGGLTYYDRKQDEQGK